MSKLIYQSTVTALGSHEPNATLFYLDLALKAKTCKTYQNTEASSQTLLH